MGRFETVYANLNKAQRQAVDTIDGPVLVIAGPGTGKTQLLSARVAHILLKTDASPQNILCLTFTEGGARNMRERLASFIGKDAYDVAVSTYHAFGSDLIRRFPEYFIETRLERTVDDLGRRQLLAALIDKLSYRDPLKQTRWHLGDLIATISEVKRGLLQPADLRTIATTNLAAIAACSPAIADTLRPYRQRLPSTLVVAEPLYRTILLALENHNGSARPPFEALHTLAANQLTQALQAAGDSGKTTPLTKWKNSWLVKDETNDYSLAGKLEAGRMSSLADVLEQYEHLLGERGLYDYEDMILRAIEALETNLDLKYTLQEQYQYILLDEFQDTNAAQLRMIELLTDNPASEGRPNVLAVGDDDQAIYAFQGAQYSNMRDYMRLYRDVLLINLTENYRSTTPILQTARAIAAQITDSLTSTIPELDKQLLPASQTEPATELAHTEYTSDVAERSAVAAEIAALVQAGCEPSHIAVLAPKHKYLEPLVPYLQDHQLNVSYERRENILAAPAIRQLLTMSRLALALQHRDQSQADSLWPEVLSYDFWGHNVADIWRLSWQASDTHAAWAKLLLDSELFRPCALLFLALAGQSADEPLEIMLDRLIGTEEVLTGDPQAPSVRSPFREYYAGPNAEPDSLYRTVTELSVLRVRLRDHAEQRGEQLNLGDLVDFANQYAAADQQLLNTSPYNQAEQAVQLMTVFKAKGLEFEHVFILHAQDNVWGMSANDSGNKLTLPANLAPIRHAGSSEDERLRTFFVAVTRAKHGLHFTSHRLNYAGKQQLRLKFLLENDDETGQTVSQVLPKPYAVVQQDNRQAPPLSALEHDWRARHLQQDTTLRALLSDRLQRYRLSPTHLTSFIDLEHAGPQAFLLQTLLKFPSAPSVDASFGNAMHGALEWVQQQVNATAAMPALAAIQQRFSELLTRQQLFGEQFALQEARGHDSLRSFLASPEAQFVAGNKAEYNFYQEGVLVGEAQLNGKIDLLEIDTANKQITIVDYKTGRLGTNPAKLHRYELQLYCYKLLLEGSHSFKNYTVKQGCLVFVEPDEAGHIQRRTVQFTAAQQERTQQLLEVMWKHVQALDIPDISGYGSSLAAIKQFEQDLLDGAI